MELRVYLTARSIFSPGQTSTLSLLKGEIYYQTYEGRVLLSEGEWTVFKEILADNQDIKIERLDAYTSSSPLVDFVLKTPSVFEFPFGEVTKTTMVVTWGNTLAGILFMSLLAISSSCVVFRFIVFNASPKKEYTI